MNEISFGKGGGVLAECLFLVGVGIVEGGGGGSREGGDSVHLESTVPEN